MGICRRDFMRYAVAGLPFGMIAAPQNRPKLLVLVLLEQFRADALDVIVPQLSPNGFRKLMYQGAHFPDCRHLASTFTSSTLATLATGSWPSQHGIVADSWFEGGVVTPASAEGLLATTFAAQVAALDNQGFRAWVIGPTQSHTAIFAGTAGAHQFFRNPYGQFTTLSDPPPWLVQFNTAKPIDAAQNAKWMAANAAPTAPPLRTLTYDVEHPQDFLRLYQSSPFAQDSQFDVLNALLDAEKLGTDKTDFVCLILGATEVLGYENGGRDPLQAQLLLDVDRNLEALLARLSKSPGDANFAFALAGGHGAPPDPPADARSRMAVNGEGVAQAIDKVLAGSNSGRVRRYIYPFLYLDPIASREPESVRAAAGRAAMANPAVAGFYTAGGYCSTRDAWEIRYRNSFNPKRSGDLMLSYKAEYVEDYQQGRGISYGSLYNYDVRVPLFLYGPQFRAATYDAPVESIDVAPTLARVLGVDQPSSCTGRVLSEAFVP
jgi:hypothetical protein